ncbi:MAG TPA: hypothetical protein PKM88_10825 [bacterium]|nr:hypothetical protein [bacterium]
MMFIDDGPGPGAAQMAADEQQWRRAERGDRELRWRCYSFVPAVITVGAGERAVPTDGVTRVRRPTGGRQLYHDRDFAYAVAGPHDHPLLAGAVADAYRRIGALWVRVLAEFGVAAELAAGRNYRHDCYCCETLTDGDVMAAGRKLVAGAQRRGRHGVMQHGSMALRPAYAAAAAALQCDADLLRRRSVALAEVAGREVSYSEVVAVWRDMLKAEEFT